MSNPDINRAEMSTPSGIENWFKKRPKWLQLAGKRLLESGELDDSAIHELAALCMQEVIGEFPDIEYSISSEFFKDQDSEKVRLCSISEISGVNKLAPSKPLEFGESNLVVIFGNNGSGKSGYVRLLKQTCGVREITCDELLGDVFTQEEIQQKAVISFHTGSATQKYEWAGGGVYDRLSSIEIFDDSFGDVFEGNHGEVCYEPPVLLFFSRLIKICDEVATKIVENKKSLISRMPRIPDELFDSNYMIWVKNLTANTSQDEVELHCSFSEEDQKRLQDMHKRISEESPAEKATKLRNRKHYADEIVKNFEGYFTKLSDNKCLELINAKHTLKRKKDFATATAEKVFSGTKIQGVGNQVWIELWNAARQYSEELAYVGKEFPHVRDDAVCVLCHQSLNQEARERFISFESYIKDTAQKQVAVASEVVMNLTDSLPDIPNIEMLKSKVDAIGIDDLNLTQAIIETVKCLQDRRSRILSVDSLDRLPRVNQAPNWFEVIHKISRSFEEKAVEYDLDSENDNRRSELKIIINNLESKKWLFENKQAIKDEILRLQKLDLIEKAKKKTDTTALSRKKGNLSENLISHAFIQRFNTELKNLNASRIKVELVKNKTSKGKVIHNIRLDGADENPKKILSEGEKRIVSIAAFLADVTGRTHPSTIVLDDPISSLDLDYEEAVVQRLCKIALNQQVIIFTHRIPLIVLFQDNGKELTIRPEIKCIRSDPWRIGEPSNTPMFAQKPNFALNDLINSKVPKFKKMLEENGGIDYDIIARGLCSEFRLLIERMIESILLNGVVLRYRRSIQTKGRIDNLFKISKNDCIYFEEILTKYSKYLHSQPIETPLVLPELDQLLTDLNNLKEWHEGFKKREIS